MGLREDADRIILIDDGQIREEGTHEALMRLNGQYAELYRFGGRSEDA